MRHMVVKRLDLLLSLSVFFFFFIFYKIFYMRISGLVYASHEFNLGGAFYFTLKGGAGGGTTDVVIWTEAVDGT